jgi:glycosyltransferase involved in cell wall biosynthesis
VLHVTPYAAEAWAYGGIPRVVASLTRGLAARGHEVTVCTTDACDEHSRLRRAPTSTDRIRVEVFRNVSNRLAYRHQLYLPVGLDTFLRREAANFDVAHIHACRNVPGVLAARRLRQAGIPYVLAPHGTAPVIERHRFAKRMFDLVAGRRMAAGASAVLALSHAERRQLMALGVDGARIRLVSAPIDADEFSRPRVPQTLRRLCDLNGQPLVLFLGQLTPRKRIDVLIQAISRTQSPAYLVVAGNDRGALAPAKAAVRALGLEARVRFTGLLREGERLDALADADLVVYASEHEVFGLVPLEALMCGTPVVVADDSGCGEVIRAVGGGQITPVGDADELARSIDRALASPDFWRAAAVRAAARIREQYSESHISEQVEEVYCDVVGHVGSADGAVERGGRPSSVPPVSGAGRPAVPVSSRTMRRSKASAAFAQSEQEGVSYVIPVRNGGTSIGSTLASVFDQGADRPMEVVVVDDGSTDDSIDRVAQFASTRSVRLIAGPRRGAAAALNAGIRAARFPIVCQVDQDVALHPGWTDELLRALQVPGVAAAQGYFETDPNAGLFARVMGLDLEQRYAGIGSGTDHVCTGNAAYRLEALERVGLFDESLGYGYDNDISYRLQAAGYRLRFCRRARSVHKWREGLANYLVQQYGFGYGRLDLVAKHPRRIGGDSVSPLTMMLHPVATLSALSCLLCGALLASVGLPARSALLLAAVLLCAAGLERLLAGIAAARRFRALEPLLFPLVHAGRDLAWVVAIIVWSIRRACLRPARPSDSMQPRRPLQASALRSTGRGRRLGSSSVLGRALVLIPAHNEAATLPGLVRELNACRPDLEVLVIDDGSVDETPLLLADLGVRWIRFPERMGIGATMRAGLRYAVRLGFDVAVRLDGDGQHRPTDIERLLSPIRDGQAEVVLGSRYAGSGWRRAGSRRYLRRSLAACLTAITGRPVTDPTSGSYALGRRAVRLLAEHHPTGYPEPELQLFLSRNGLHVIEVPVSMRSRTSGRTSLTPSRLMMACARVVLAMIVVPFRCAVSASLD